MGVRGMQRANAAVLAMLILANLALTMAGEPLSIIAGVALLAAGAYLCFRQGMQLGHGACGIRGTVEAARKAGPDVYAQLDQRYICQVWNRKTGLRGALASALVPLIAGAVYILLSLAGRAPEALLLIARTAAWLLSLPFWPLIAHWHRDFVTLTPAIVAMLLLSPFALPACAFLGYLRGPSLWANSEEAMKQGRRRAKARSRVGKKLAPRPQKPEI